MARRPNPALAHGPSVEAVLRGNHIPQSGWSDYIAQHYRLTGNLAPGCDMADFYAAYIPRWLAGYGWRQQGAGWIDPEQPEAPAISEKDAHVRQATRLHEAERARKATVKQLLGAKSRRGRTLDELAASTGIELRHLEEYQRGRAVPPVEHLAAIQQALTSEGAPDERVVAAGVGN